ncbi:MAG: hypothetical protein ACD_79C01091G0005 [uncultured bacterium]|nr:MAG: hypothetical protein ACD_79C01091G0005 [uncultured bacterium]
MDNKSILQFNLESDLIIKRIFFGLLFIELFLVANDFFCYFILKLSGTSISKVISVSCETSIANWFSSVQFLLIGLIFIFVSLIKHKDEGLKKSFMWILFGLFFLYFSVDDGAGIHEQISLDLRKYIQSFLESKKYSGISNLLNRFPSYAWQLILGPVFLVMGYLIFIFFWNKLKTVKIKLMFLSSILFLILAEVMDFIEGLNESFLTFVKQYTDNTTSVIHLIMVFEEFLEMFAITLFFITCLKILFEELNNCNFKIINSVNYKK